ncbi:SH3 domain-containing protein [Hafnia alvei]|uniref:SH3 domain-containing protein n=1 Tax=Hafnia alvei TaxID=569 RepID=UPI004043A0BF
MKNKSNFRIRELTEKKQRVMTETMKAVAIPGTSDNLHSNLTSHSAITEAMKAVAMPNISESLRSSLTSHSAITEAMKAVAMPNISESLRSSLTSHSAMTEAMKAVAMPNISESLRSSLTSHSAMTEAMKAVAMPSISESLSSALTSHSAITEAMKAIAIPSISESLRANMAQHSAITEAMKAVAMPNINESLRYALELQRNTIADAMNAVAIPNISTMLSSALESQNVNITDVLKIRKSTSFLDGNLFSTIVDSGLGKMAKAIADTSNSSNNHSSLSRKLNSTMEEMARKVVTFSSYNPSNKTLIDNSFLTAALAWSNSPVGKEMASIINIQNVDDSVIGDALELSEVVTSHSSRISNKKTIFEQFHALPPFIQQIITWILCEVLLSILADAGKEYILIAINKTESYVSSLLNEHPITQKEIISSNPDINWKELNKFRLITADNVNMRTKPSMSADVIETLNKNTAIAVIDSTNRQWLYIQVIFHGEKTFGWVNRSYTKRLGL